MVNFQEKPRKCHILLAFLFSHILIKKSSSISFTTLRLVPIWNILCTFWVLADTTTCIFRTGIMLEVNTTQMENKRGIMHMRFVVVVLFPFFYRRNCYSQSIRILAGRILWISVFWYYIAEINSMNLNVIGETVCLCLHKICGRLVNKKCCIIVVYT